MNNNPNRFIDEPGADHLIELILRATKKKIDDIPGGTNDLFNFWSKTELVPMNDADVTYVLDKLFA